MNQFKILATEYSEKGALTNITHAYYYPTADVAEQQMAELNREYHVDADGNKTNIKMYKVELFVQSFKKIDNPANFFAMFK